MPQNIKTQVPGTFLEEDTYDALRAFAKGHGLSMNAVATLAVEAMIETEDE